MDLEREFLEWMKRDFSLDNRFGEVNLQVVKGIGDDCAVIDRGKYFELVESDVLTEGNHFLGKWASPEQIGRKAIESNVSDIAAMGGTPRYLFVGLTLPKDTNIEYVKMIYKGMKQICEKYKIELLGGDTTCGHEMTISITLLGEVEKKRVIFRGGAKENDLVAVTGSLGASMAGFSVLRFCDIADIALDDFLNTFSPGDRAAFNFCIDRHLVPVAQFEKGRVLSKCGVSAMIDVSDGLASEAKHIASESGMGVRIYEKNIVVDQRVLRVAELMKIDPMKWVLSGGEDFELLFAAPQKVIKKVKKEFEVQVVGEITAVPHIEGNSFDEFRYVFERMDGSCEELSGGYNHFA